MFGYVIRTVGTGEVITCGTGFDTEEEAQGAGDENLAFWLARGRGAAYEVVTYEEPIFPEETP
jgi:hypothetical protein